VSSNSWSPGTIGAAVSSTSMMLDHPDVVTKGTVLDIAPTLTMYDDTSKEFATKYVWWFFQIQPPPMPEHMISLDPGYYLRDHLAVQGKTPGAVTPEAMAEYIRCYCCKGTVRAVCEDYRERPEPAVCFNFQMSTEFGYSSPS
jgi:haloacetate dehalogenase